MMRRICRIIVMQSSLRCSCSCHAWARSWSRASLTEFSITYVGRKDRCHAFPIGCKNKAAQCVYCLAVLTWLGTTVVARSAVASPGMLCPRGKNTNDLRLCDHPLPSQNIRGVWNCADFGSYHLLSRSEFFSRYIMKFIHPSKKWD